MTTDRLRAAVAAGRPSFGSWVTLGDPLAAEIMGAAGFDWLIVDTQHGAIGWDGVADAIRAAELGGTRALVRVGGNDPVQIMRALDLGALGVVVPMVSTPEQARDAAAATRYPPEGVRSYGPIRGGYGAAVPTEPPLCFAMIETAEALANLNAIAATPGVDGLFVGPVDLALSLGLGPALAMPDRVLAAVEAVVMACGRTGAIPGCASLGLDNAAALVARGMRFVTIGSDAGLIRRGAAADLARARHREEVAPARTASNMPSIGGA